MKLKKPAPLGAGLRIGQLKYRRAVTLTAEELYAALFNALVCCYQINGLSSSVCLGGSLIQSHSSSQKQNRQNRN